MSTAFRLAACLLGLASAADIRTFSIPVDGGDGAAADAKETASASKQSGGGAPAGLSAMTGLVSNMGAGGGSNDDDGSVVEIEMKEGEGIGDAIAKAMAAGPLHAEHRRRPSGLGSLMERLMQLGRRRPPPRRHTPVTLVGSVLLPLLAALVVGFELARRFQPAKTQAFLGRAAAWPLVVRAAAALELARVAAVRRGATLHLVTRVCVSLYFVHEGSAAFQTKYEQFSDSLIPIATPFGILRTIPPWQKGDAVDLVLLVTALCTMVGRVIPVEVGLVLLLVDVMTDCTDLVGQMAIAYLSQGQLVVNELMAKKFSLLGVMVLVAFSRWRAQQHRHTLQLHQLPTAVVGGAAATAPPGGASGATSAAAAAAAAAAELASTGALLSSVALLAGRLLIAVLFLHVGNFELHRLIWSPEYVDIDPNDGHNVLWPKLLELALAVPFVLGLRTKMVARLLAATLLLEALTVWQFWWAPSLGAQLHARQHFAVNVAVAGGLLLIQEVGGGKYTVDEFMKKLS